MIFNLGMAEFVFVVLLVGVLALTWPNPPWTWLTWASGLAVILLPILFYPFSLTLFLAFDLLFHPPGPRDFEEARTAE